MAVRIPVDVKGFSLIIFPLPQNGQSLEKHWRWRRSYETPHPLSLNQTLPARTTILYSSSLPQTVGWFVAFWFLSQNLMFE